MKLITFTLSLMTLTAFFGYMSFIDAGDNSGNQNARSRHLFDVIMGNHAHVHGHGHHAHAHGHHY